MPTEAFIGKEWDQSWDGDFNETGDIEPRNSGEFSLPGEKVSPPPAELVSSSPVVLALPPPSKGINSTLTKKTIMAFFE